MTRSGFLFAILLVCLFELTFDNGWFAYSGCLAEITLILHVERLFGGVSDDLYCLLNSLIRRVFWCTKEMLDPLLWGSFNCCWVDPCKLLLCKRASVYQSFRSPTFGRSKMSLWNHFSRISLLYNSTSLSLTPASGVRIVPKQIQDATVAPTASGSLHMKVSGIRVGRSEASCNSRILLNMSPIGRVDLWTSLASTLAAGWLPARLRWGG